MMFNTVSLNTWSQELSVLDTSCLLVLTRHCQWTLS